MAFILPMLQLGILSTETDELAASGARMEATIRNLHILPVEVRYKIGRNLCIRDIVSLAYSSPQLYDALFHRVWPKLAQNPQLKLECLTPAITIMETTKDIGSATYVAFSTNGPSR